MAVICSLRPHRGEIITRVIRGINEVKRILGSGSDTDKDNFNELLFKELFSLTFFLPNIMMIGTASGFYLLHSLYSITRVSAQPSILHLQIEERGGWATRLSVLPSTDRVLYI